jgi:uroporphyrinogen-III synthase
MILFSKTYFWIDINESFLLRQVFTESGFSVIFVPPLEFEWVNQDLLKSILLNDSSKYSGVIVTSPRAMEALGSVIECLKNEIITNTNTHIKCVDELLFKWSTLPLFAVVPNTKHFS